jgi:hypothetical protein
MVTRAVDKDAGRSLDAMEASTRSIARGRTAVARTAEALLGRESAEVVLDAVDAI